MAELLRSTEHQDDYDPTGSGLMVVHYKTTNEIVLVDLESCTEILMVDYDEAGEVAELILKLVKAHGN